MRRGGPEAAGGVRPSYRSSNASLPTTTTPRGRAPSTPSTATTVLVNLDGTPSTAFVKQQGGRLTD